MDENMPALFFGVRDRRNGARRPYRDPWESCPFPVKEIVIRPSVGEKPYLLRFDGQVTEWVSVREAAAEAARSLLQTTVPDETEDR